MASDDVARRLDEVRWSTEGLLSALRERPPTDSWAGQPSLLPGWTRGHVLSHLARNADAMVRALAGAARGERIPMYDSEDVRAADIEGGRRADGGRAGRRRGRDREPVGADLVPARRRRVAARRADPERSGAGDPAHRDALARGRDPPRRPGRPLRARRLAGVVRGAAAALAARPAADRPAGCRPGSRSGSSTPTRDSAGWSARTCRRRPGPRARPAPRRSGRRPLRRYGWSGRPGRWSAG